MASGHLMVQCPREALGTYTLVSTVFTLLAAVFIWTDLSAVYTYTPIMGTIYPERQQSTVGISGDTVASEMIATQ